MEALGPILGPMALWIPVVLIGIGILAWFRFKGPTMAREAARRKEKDADAKTSDHKEDSAHGHQKDKQDHDHKKDNHGGGGNSFVVALITLAVTIFVIFFVVPWLKDVGRPPGASHSQRIAMAPQGTLTDAQEATIPRIACKGKTEVAYVIPPHSAAIVPIPLGQSLDMTPKTSEGVLRACAVNSRGLCSRNGEALSGDLDEMLLQNTSSRPVAVRCWYI